MESIDRAVEFCTELDPGFPERLSGSPPAQIDRLEALVGRPLHPAHRRYLELLGEDPGGLDFGPGTMRAGDIAQAYESTTGAPPDHVTLFGIEQEDPYKHVFAIDEGDEQPILARNYAGLRYTWRGFPRDPFEFLADSIAQFVCIRAVHQFVFERAPGRRNLTQGASRPRALQLLARHLEELELEILWFSGKRVLAARSGSIYLHAQKLEGAALGVALCGQPEQAQELTDLLLALQDPETLGMKALRI